MDVDMEYVNEERQSVNVLVEQVRLYMEGINGLTSSHG